MNESTPIYAKIITNLATNDSGCTFCFFYKGYSCSLGKDFSIECSKIFGIKTGFVVEEEYVELYDKSCKIINLKFGND